MTKVAKLLPDFIAAAQASLQAQNHADLARQLSDLELSRWTHEPEENAMYLYLSGQAPLNSVEEVVIGVHRGECIELDDLDGMVVVDTDNFNRITGIEVLWRDDVAGELKEKMAPDIVKDRINNR